MDREEDENQAKQDIICPFCDEGHFDLPGLKLHLYRYCDAFKETEDL
jgi:hypothetical protein